MATPLTASRIVEALRAEGCKVVEHRNWRTHNRNHKDAWGPVNGVMIHHTVSSGTDHSVALCYNGHSALPGPLCHTVGAKDGTLYMVGHGRANHAGKGDRAVLDAVIAERPLPPDRVANTDGNSRFYGIELINLGNGKDPWPAEQVEAAAQWAAALCRAHGWSERSVIAHKEWQPGKIDPTFDMGTFRARVKQLLSNSPGKPPEEGLDMNEKQVFDAVTNRDAVPAPTRASTYKTNPTWKMKNYFPELWDQGSRTSEKVDKLTALVEKLTAEVADLSKQVKS